ncbi:MAG: GntR family transcriptional regulator [Nocardioidaceae bacterium]
MSLVNPGADGGRTVLRRSILGEQVYEALKAQIMNHVIRPGARISIDGLARDLGVSPTPVREALAVLESEELATKEPLRGYRATPLLTREQFDDLYRFRLLLEPWAAAEAAAHAGSSGIAALRSELASCSSEPHGEDYEAYKALTAHDTRFHTLVSELSGSNQAHRAFVRTHCHLHIFRLHYERSIGVAAIAEHHRVVEAIATGDPAAAETAMTAHLQAALERLRPLYDRPTERPSPDEP